MSNVWFKIYVIFVMSIPIAVADSSASAAGWITPARSLLSAPPSPTTTRIINQFFAQLKIVFTLWVPSYTITSKYTTILIEIKDTSIQT